MGRLADAQVLVGSRQLQLSLLSRPKAARQFKIPQPPRSADTPVEPTQATAV